MIAEPKGQYNIIRAKGVTYFYNVNTSETIDIMGNYVGLGEWIDDNTFRVVQEIEV